MDILENSRWSNLFEARKERLAMEAEAELMKAQALSNIANKPAQRTSPLIYLIPVVGILVIGAIVIISKKRKK